MRSARTGGREFQRAMNPLTLERLSANGSDLSRPHCLFNVFHIYQRPQVESLRRDLEAVGFLIHDSGTLLEYQGTHYWKAEGCIEIVPTLAAVNSMTDQCVEVAGRHDADYDGWYTEVVTSESEPEYGPRTHPG